MKKILILCLCLCFFGCKKESKNENNPIVKNDNLKLLQGDFLFLKDDAQGDAAVLTTKQAIYGVVIDDVMLELNKRCEEFKNTSYDMASVIVKGIVKPNSVKNGWKEVVEIKKIISVRAPNKTNKETVILKQE